MADTQLLEIERAKNAVLEAKVSSLTAELAELKSKRSRDQELLRDTMRKQRKCIKKLAELASKS